MIILHLGFRAGTFYLWGEASATQGTKSVKAKKSKRKSTQADKAADIRWSPFNPTKTQFSETLWEADLSFDVETTQDVKAWLPSTSKTPFPSSPVLWENGVQLKGDVFISPWQITAIPLNLDQVIELLVTSNKRTVLAPGILAGEGLQFCATAFQYANALVTNEQFLPGLISENDRFYARWKPVFLGEEAARLAVLAEAMPASVRALSDKEVPSQPATQILKEMLSLCVDYLVRESNIKMQEVPHQPAVFDSVHDQWLHALGASEGSMTGPWANLAHLNEKIEEWQHSISISTQTSFLLVFRLEEPNLNDDKEDTWYVRFLLQAVDDPSLLVDVEKAWNPDKRITSLFNKRGFSPHEYLLVSLGQAAGLVPLMENSLKKSRPGGFELGTEDAFTFLTETAWLLRQAGFGVLLPSWWIRKGTRGRLSAHATVKSPNMKSSSGLSLDNLVQFDWQVALGDEVLTQQEMDTLSRAKMPLINLRGQWVHVDLDTIKSVVAYWKNSGAKEMTARDIVQMALGMAKAPGDLSFEDIEASGWIGDLLDQLKDDSTVEEQAVSEKFEGTLRPYQLRGYSWLAFHERWGLGACLADDMGLGKTIQTLAIIQKNYDNNIKKPVLLVCPTSVIGNWQKEAERFTPNLSILMHHGVQREKKLSSFRKQIKGVNIVITGYALVHRDFALLSKINWHTIVLDEAQNIKNPETKQSKAARSLKSNHRIALTGTPVENNIGDLWSIMEFLNPGFLGTAATFKKTFFAPIQVKRDPEAIERLKRITGPFILRRLKTDKTIIDDLPDKQEMKVFTSLTKEQASLYEAVVKEMTGDLKNSEGIQRKGMVLSLLMKLKQICNHPAQFLHDGSAVMNRSGKLSRLTEMLEQILMADERALIFTQFTEMGEMIRRHLQEMFGREVLFLHGGTSRKKRDTMVERFQEEENGPPIFLLSLKAGGTGLNLTRANHVFHFDRWWNPAIENQATDRAFRIGQKHQVQVHKFVCLGTVEERIDEMIENKREIADSTVRAGEKWITELSTEELKNLFELRMDVVED